MVLAAARAISSSCLQRRVLSSAAVSDAGCKSLRPPLHFRLDRVTAQLHWTPDAILDAVNRLQDAELAVKTGAPDDETHAPRHFGICIRGRALKR